MQLKNHRIRLEFRPDAGLTVIDRANPKTWRTDGPLLVLHAWDRMLDRQVTTAAPSDACTIAVRRDRAADSATLRVRWTETAIELDLGLHLVKDGFQVRTMPRRIRERNANRFRLLSAELLPDFGAARRGQPGYMLLPNASGALCRFDRTKTQSCELRNWVYMHQREWEAWCMLPLFGMKHEDGAAFLCILESGEWDTQVVARLNVAGTDRHTVHPHLHFRENKTDRIDPVERVVRYVFLHGTDAGYVGMAKRYREYLLAERGARSLRERAAASPALAYEATAHTCKVFMASKTRRTDGKGRYDLFTTFDQAAEVMTEFKRHGLGCVSYEFVGWCPDGHDGMYPRRFPVDPRVGGLAGLRRFQRLARDAGHRVGVHDNYVDMYQASPDYDPDLLAVDRDGELVLGGVWSGGQMYYICGSQALRFAKRDLPRLKRLGLDGILYLDAMPRVPRPCHAAGHGHVPGSRRADGAGVIALLQYARRVMDGQPLGCENVMGYTIPYQDFAGHIPQRAANGGVPAEFADEWVPFFQIAVHGLLKYHLGDPRQGGGPEGGTAWLLREIEYGAMPRFEYQYRDRNTRDGMQFHFGDWRPWLPVLAAQHRVLCDELGPLQFEWITGHERTRSGVSRTAGKGLGHVVLGWLARSGQHRIQQTERRCRRTDAMWSAAAESC